jgi:hypothetical protein
MTTGQQSMAMCQVSNSEREEAEEVKDTAWEAMPRPCAHMDQCDGIKANPMHLKLGPDTFAARKSKKSNANLDGMC